MLNIVVKFLEENLNEEYSNECLYAIQNHEVIFFSGGKPMSNKHMLETYITRYRIQKEVTKVEFVTGYENLLKNFERHIEKDTVFVEIVRENISYIIFPSSDYQKLYGILKIKSDKTLDQERQLLKENEARGFGSGCFILNKGQIINEKA